MTQLPPYSNLNPKRRYHYTAMVPERQRAMDRLEKRLDKISAEGLERAEKWVRTCRNALSSHAPPINTPRPTVLAQRRKLEGDLFYAIVERDAYRLVLNQIEPKRTFTRTPSANPALLATLRYRRKRILRQIVESEYELATLTAKCVELRTKVEQCAATTYLLQTELQTKQAEAVLLRGPRARVTGQRGAPSLRKQVLDSRRAWRVEYDAWKKAHDGVKRLRLRLARQRTTAESMRSRIAGLIEGAINAKG